MATKTYSPDFISIVAAGVPLSNFADGTFITISTDVARWTKKIGADGEVTRSASMNRGGSFKLVLNQASESNDFLSTLYQTDEVTGNGVFPVTIRDSSGATLAFAAEAWVEKLPDVAYGVSAGDREWTITTGRLELFVGGIS